MEQVEEFTEFLGTMQSNSTETDCFERTTTELCTKKFAQYLTPPSQELMATFLSDNLVSTNGSSGGSEAVDVLVAFSTLLSRANELISREHPFDDFVQLLFITNKEWVISTEKILQACTKFLKEAQFDDFDNDNTYDSSTDNDLTDSNFNVNSDSTISTEPKLPTETCNLASASDSSSNYGDEHTESEECQLHGVCATGDLTSLSTILANAHHIEHLMSCVQLGVTPLGTAAKHGQIDVVAYILDNKFAMVDQPQCPEASDLPHTPIGVACAAGQLEVAKYLYAAGARLDVPHVEDRSLLEFACSAGQLEVVKWLHVHLHVKLQSRNVIGSTPLLRAARHGHLGVVEYLQRNYASIDTPTKYGRTPIWFTCTKGHVSVLKYLHENGASLDVIDRNGQTLLFAAVDAGQLEVVKYLHQRGVSLVTPTHSQVTPLSAAAEKGHVSVVKYLLDTGNVPVDTQDTQGATALWSACCYGRLDVIKLLHSRGASIHTAVSGLTPATVSSELGYLDVLQYLHHQGAELEGSGCLVSAARFHRKEVIEYLVDCGVDVNLPDETGCPPLYAACSEGHLDAVEFLVGKGAALDGGYKGFPPWIIAAQTGYLDIVQFFHQHGVDIGKPSQNGCTCSYVVCANGHIAVLRYLYAEGIPINLPYLGYTPLLLGCTMGHIEIVKFFHEHGFDCTESGRDSLFVAACTEGHLRMVEYLVDVVGVDYEKEGSKALTSAIQLYHVGIVEFLNSLGIFLAEKYFRFSDMVLFPPVAHVHNGHIGASVLKYHGSKSLALAMNIRTNCDDQNCKYSM